MQIGYSTRIYPSDKQASTLLQWIGCARKIWNSKVEENQYYYTFGKKFVPINQWQWLKDENGKRIEPEYQWVDYAFSRHKDKELTPYLSDCPSQILRNSTTNWFNTQMKFQKGECGPPRKKQRADGGSIYLTNEVFKVVGVKDGVMEIFVGTKTNNIGTIVVPLRRKLPSLPNSITIRICSRGKWYIGFSVDDATGVVADESDLRKDWFTHLKTLPTEELKKIVHGFDRGIKVPVAGTDRMFTFSVSEKRQLTKLYNKIKFLQRQKDRQKKGSKRREKTKKRISNYHQDRTNIKKDVAHKITCTLARDERIKVYVLENLKLRNMTKSAAGTVDKPGKNVKQKSGLNREILDVGLYRIENFLRYKAVKAGKIVLKVAPQYTSQECSHCGYTHKDNRPEQSVFVCGSCGHVANADQNAAAVIASRAINLILDPGTGLSDEGVLRSKSDIARSTRKSKTSALAEATREKRSAA